VPIDTLRSQATLREGERRFRELLDALPAAVYTTDAAGRITYYNDAAAMGYWPPLGSSEWCGSWKLFWPDGTPLPHDQCPMAVIDNGSNGRIVLSGPEVPITSQLAVPLGMAIHELTTNATQYGALSIFGGKVEVTWSVTINATRHTLAFDWMESGGPPVAQPARKGFGSRLLAFILPGQIQAKSQIDYAPDGIRIHCGLPLPADSTI
jgi:hypothetical protein